MAITSPQEYDQPMAYKRTKMTKRRSKRAFRNGAKRTHRRNVGAGPMRGGIRL